MARGADGAVGAGVVEAMGDDAFMKAALVEARKALETGFFPVGAVAVQGGRVLARAHKTMGSNLLDHAETNLMWDLFGQDDGVENAQDITVYTTLEPCVMCYGMMRHCKIGRIVYAMEDPYGGAAHTPDEVLPMRHRTGNRGVLVEGGVLREDARKFFAEFLATTQEPFWVQGGAAIFQEAVKNDKF